MKLVKLLLEEPEAFLRNLRRLIRDSMQGELAEETLGAIIELGRSIEALRD